MHHPVPVDETPDFPVPAKTASDLAMFSKPNFLQTSIQILTLLSNDMKMRSPCRLINILKENIVENY